MTFAMLQRAHVRIDTVYAHLSSRLRAILDLVGQIATIAFFSLVTWYVGGVLQQSIESNSHSVSALAVPLALPQTIWALGFVVFLVTATVLLLRAFIAFAKGDIEEVHAIIGARSTKKSSTPSSKA